jgi:hypothetical protein
MYGIGRGSKHGMKFMTSFLVKVRDGLVEECPL